MSDGHCSEWHLPRCPPFLPTQLLAAVLFEEAHLVSASFRGWDFHSWSDGRWKDKTKTCESIWQVFINQISKCLRKKTSILDKINLKKRERVILYSLRFGRLAGLLAFKPDPPSMSTYCPQTTTGQLTHKECSSATARSSNAWSRSSLERARSLRQAGEHHSCFKDPATSARPHS